MAPVDVLLDGLPVGNLGHVGFRLFGVVGDGKSFWIGQLGNDVEFVGLDDPEFVVRCFGSREDDVVVECEPCSLVVLRCDKSWMIVETHSGDLLGALHGPALGLELLGWVSNFSKSGTVYDTVVFQNV